MCHFFLPRLYGQRVHGFLYTPLISIPFFVLGQQMCALCPADAQRENLGGRCKGHGVDSHLTKWRSTFRPKCHGKWKRVKELRHCPCIQGPDYVFV